MPTDLAICLRRSDYSETSLVVRLMTRGHGQVALLAKGVKRPKSRFGGSIDLLTVGQAVFNLPRGDSPAALGLLTAWEQTAVYPCLRTDLLRHAVATTAGELLGRLTAELDPHPASFDAMVRLLESLQAGEPPVRRLAQFGRSLLADVGLTPNFESCVNCGGNAHGPGVRGQGSGEEASDIRHRASGGEAPASGSPIPASRRPRVPASVVFSGRRAGVLCPACRPLPGEDAVAISHGLKDFFMGGEPTSGKLALEIVRWLVYHVQHQIGQALHSAAALERAIAAALAAFAASRRPAEGK